MQTMKSLISIFLLKSWIFLHLSIWYQSNNNMKGFNGDEILQYKMSLENVAEQEERRMSDLSDMASSVTSAADIQVLTL